MNERKRNLFILVDNVFSLVFFVLKFSLIGVRGSYFESGVPENYLFAYGAVYGTGYHAATRQLFVMGMFNAAGDVPASNAAVFQFAENPKCVGKRGHMTFTKKS